MPPSPILGFICTCYLIFIPKPLLDTWISAPWQEFVNIANAPDSSKLKSYYYNGKMRFEPIRITNYELKPYS